MRVFPVTVSVALDRMSLELLPALTSNVAISIRSGAGAAPRTQSHTSAIVAAATTRAPDVRVNHRQL